MKKLFPAALILLLFAFACSQKSTSGIGLTPEPVEEPAQWDDMGKPDAADEEMVDQIIMEESVITPDMRVELPDSLPRYNASHTMAFDLLHTKLELSFDWEQSRANGKATLTLKPWFYSTDQLVLDAKNFDIHGVSMSGKPLKYTYDNTQLSVNLGKTYSRNDELTVVIDYTAKPDEREEYGGSAAISGDKGLYFINPKGETPNKPQQIWTQGETESNSYWFPTIDKPNERCTQEMYLTVQDRYKTLSNGVLVSSKKNADGTRTDYWKMDKPHAPYLFMMAIGEFAVVKDKWRDIELGYYVEPEYEAYAKDIFPYTPEMLEYFSNKLNYPYPWSKYSQVVVRDYVSGAMENTTGVIFGEFVQMTGRELMDDHWTNEKIVAHEMFHHWFGDLVTTENWANLTLNEGFANYSEYMWLEHKYGRNEADYHALTERQGYLFSTQNGIHPLIHFGYENREDMFDGHSYNKGGAVLHMLRDYVGDEAFFASLNRYLKDNEYSDVEAHELRLAFEDVTGEDMNWFFNQWFYGAGSPTLVIDYKYDEAAKQMIVMISQTQDPEDDVPYIFELPLKVDIYDASGNVRRENIRMTRRDQTFTFDAPSRPAFVNVDATKTLLCEKEDNHTPGEWAFLFRNSSLFMDRYEAIKGLSDQVDGAIVSEMLKDKSRHFRLMGLEEVDLEDPEMLNMVIDMAEHDPDPDCKAEAITLLGETGDEKYIPLMKKGLATTEPYSVVSASLQAIGAINPVEAAEVSKTLQSDDNERIATALAKLYAANPDVEQVPFFEKQIAQVDQMAAFSVFGQYSKFVTGLNDAVVTGKAVENLKSISLNFDTSQWRRFASTKALADMRNFYQKEGNSEQAQALAELVDEIKEKETDPTLKLYYGMF